MNDIIADLFAKLRFGAKTKRKVIFVRKTRFSLQILSYLQNCGYIRNFYSKNNSYFIGVYFVHNETGRIPLTNIRKVSRLSLRIYKTNRTLERFYKNSLNVLISTSVGLTDLRSLRNSRKKLGGEVIATLDSGFSNK
jgi:ribosomal protein S8